MQKSSKENSIVQPLVKVSKIRREEGKKSSRGWNSTK